jgi:hypothetical protein
MSHYTTEKISWGEAIRRYVIDKGEAGGFMKLLFVLERIGLVVLPIQVVDDVLDLIPYLNFITVGDNIFAVAFIGYSVIRISWIRHQSGIAESAAYQQ